MTHAEMPHLLCRSLPLRIHEDDVNYIKMHVNYIKMHVT